jgi:predicted transcriptional regulator
LNATNKILYNKPEANMTEKNRTITIDPALYDQLSKIAERMKISPDALIAEALSGYAGLNEMQRREIEHRLNDHAQDRFASETEMDALFGKYRNAH